MAFIFSAVIAILLAMLTASAFQIITITDNSMLPTIEEGQHAIINRWAYKKEDPQKNDFVVFSNRVYTMTGEGFLMTKRVIGESNDRVMMTGESVYLNNKVIDEDYIFMKSPCEFDEVKVPKGKVFVLGDNRTYSTDSRNKTVGMVDKRDIIGKVIFIW